MGACQSSKAVSSDEGKNARFHPATGLQPGDLPHPTKSCNGSRQGTPSRRPSTTDSSGKKSPVPSLLNPGTLSLLLSLASAPENAPREESSFELELYDTCPTPFHGGCKNGDTKNIGLNLMTIEFITASVDDRNVKPQMDELITGGGALHIKGGLRTVLGVCPDSDDEVFSASYIYRSERQLHLKCEKKSLLMLRAPAGLQLRIICVSYHGHDYVAAANSLLKENNSLLDIPAGKLEEKLHCPQPKSGLLLEAPFLFTYILESATFHKKCGIYEDFLIEKYPSTIEEKSEEEKNEIAGASGKVLETGNEKLSKESESKTEINSKTKS